MKLYVRAGFPGNSIKKSNSTWDDNNDGGSLFTLETLGGPGETELATWGTH